MEETPLGNRLHIAIFGRRNAGKSSLINSLTGQDTSLVSEHPGTTADPVNKTMELLPLGPVVFIDTAGFDDEGALGEKRVERTKKIIEKTDVALLVFDAANRGSFDYELSWYNILTEKKIPVIGVLNKKDLLDNPDDEGHLKAYSDIFPVPFAAVCVNDKRSIDKLKGMLADEAPVSEKTGFVANFIKKHDIILLVMPQDRQAPKGRLILPQAQAVRDILDKEAIGIATTVSALPKALEQISSKPDLVITDSQVFYQVKEIVADEVPLTSFSVLMAGFKGDIEVLSEGAKTISSLSDNDIILIAEACTHHAIKNDIGREKIPDMLCKYTKKDLKFDVKSGNDFPEDVSGYALVIHCGACMLNRRQFMSRIRRCRIQKVPVTNYGMAIAYMQDILRRVLEVFEMQKDKGASM